MMKPWESRCQICGETKSWLSISELKPTYRIFDDLVDVCDDCGKSINRHVNYYGKKKEKDKAAVKSKLLAGAVVNERFRAMMFAGYYIEIKE